MAPARIVAIRDIGAYRGRMALALSYNPWDYGLADVEDQVSGGHMVALDLDNRACAILEIVSTRQGRMLHIAAVAGEGMDDWLPGLDEAVMKLAREQDCSGIMFAGRPGWQRALRGLGYSPTRVTMTKAV